MNLNGLRLDGRAMLSAAGQPSGARTALCHLWSPSKTGPTSSVCPEEMRSTRLALPGMPQTPPSGPTMATVHFHVSCDLKWPLKNKQTPHVSDVSSCFALLCTSWRLRKMRSPELGLCCEAQDARAAAGEAVDSILSFHEI